MEPALIAINRSVFGHTSCSHLSVAGNTVIVDTIDRLKTGGIRGSYDAFPLFNMLHLTIQQLSNGPRRCRVIMLHHYPTKACR